MEGIKDIIEILSLADDEIKKNDKNASAILDLQDLKSLKCLYNKYIEEKEKNKELQEKLEISLHTIKILDNLLDTKQKDFAKKCNNLLLDFKKNIKE